MPLRLQKSRKSKQLNYHEICHIVLKLHKAVASEAEANWLGSISRRSQNDLIESPLAHAFLKGAKDEIFWGSNA